MIVVKLMGGLGNQLFQYAAGKTLAMRHKVPLKLDLSFLNEDAGAQHTKRELALDVFKTDVSLASPQELKEFKDVSRSRRFLQRYFPVVFKNYFTANEKHFAFDPEFFRYPENTYLNGFWQSEKYFAEIRKILLEEIVLKEKLSGENLMVAQHMAAANSVSLHIRRGDYVTNKNAQAFHGTLPLHYYEKAIDYINSRVSEAHFFIFSDDIFWVKEHLTIDNKVTYVDFNQGQKSAIDLHLMRLCKHNIVANSSFSWWGAWLNQHDGKIVIAPENWFLDKSINTKDLIPETWVKR